MVDKLQSAKHVYIIGIGGIGVSALARMLINRGVEVSGVNDDESPETLDSLRDKGVQITFYDSESEDAVPEFGDNIDAFVYSVAWEDRGLTLLVGHELVENLF